MSSASRERASARHTRTALRRPRSFLLTSTALAGGVLACVANLNTALSAACVGQNTDTVICDNVTTNNFAERITTNNINGTTTVTIGPGFLNGFGLGAVQNTSEGSALQVTNTGTVTLNNALAVGVAALQLTGDGGAVTYTGSGSINNAVTGSFALGITNTLGGNISISSSGPITGGISATVGNSVNGITEFGNIAITNTSIVNGGINPALFIQAEAGTTTITNSGTLTGSFAGINASGDVGTITITNTGNINATSSGANGINISWADPFLITGAVTINSTGNITGRDNGINAFSDEGPLTIRVNNVSGTTNNGINAARTLAA